MKFITFVAILGLVTVSEQKQLKTLEELAFLQNNPLNELDLFDINGDGTIEGIKVYFGSENETGVKEVPSVETSPEPSSSNEAESSPATSSPTEAPTSAEPAPTTSSTTEAPTSEEPAPTTSSSTEAPTSAEPEITSASPEDKNPTASTHFPREITSTESSDTSKFTDAPEPEDSTPRDDESTTPSHCGDAIVFYTDYRAHDNSIIRDIEIRLECPGRLTENQLHDFIMKIQAGATDETHPIPATEDESADEPETLEEEATTGQNAGEEEQVLTEEEFKATLQKDPHPDPIVLGPIDLGDLPHVPALSEEEAKKLLDVPDFKDVTEQGAVSPSSQPGNEASSEEPLQPAEEELSPEEAEKLLGGNPDLQVLDHPEAVSPSSESEKEPTVGEPLPPDEELSPEQVEALVKENPDAVIPDDDVANSEPQNQISPDDPTIPDQTSDPIMSEAELQEYLAANPGYAEN